MALRRNLREMVVIVLSILIAFGIDANWDEYRDAQIERRVLGGLHDDFAANLSLIDEGTASHRRVVRAAQVILRATGPEARPYDGLKRDLGAANALWMTNVRTGALNAVIASGQLALISDESLRQALASWPDQVADFQEEEEIGATQVFEWLHPFLRDRVPNRDIDIAVGFLSDTAPSAFAPDYASLLQTLAFENIVELRMTVAMITISEAEGLQVETNRILAAIEEQL